MNAPWMRSLQGRLTALVLAGVAGIWLATAVVTWRDVSHELDELLDSHLAQAAALLVVQQAGESHDDDGHRQEAPLLHRYATQVAFQVWHEGRLVQRSANAPVTPWLPVDAAFKRGFRTLDMGGQPWRVFATHGAERDVQVFVGEQLKSRRSILWAVLHGTLWPLALALPLLALAVWWAVRRGSAPLRQLGLQLAARDPRALEPVGLADAPSEMTPMVSALNQLFARIAGLMEAERRFTADAAHELRTPIAAIRAQAQVALNETDDAQRRHALQATLLGCDRAARLVDQLLTLARVEAQGPSSPAAPPGGDAAAPRRTDLAALARRIAADLAPAAIERGQSLDLQAPTPAPIEADETLAGVLLRNLLDNASRYSPAGATLRAEVAAREGQVVLVIEDSGPGLEAADLDRLGQRFFRVLGQQAPGSGLGWSIVRRIAATQGAAVEVSRSVALGGLKVQVSWPLAGG